MNAIPVRAALPCETCEVLVIGGGPAGATTAALLAERGRDVVLLEKAHHPRFHIGESLLPANAALFDRLGVRNEVEALGLRKWGVEFVSPEHEHASFVEFADAWDKTMPYAWQVRRSELDEVLFRHAARRGVRTFEGCRVREADFDADGAQVRAELDGQGGGSARSWCARFVVDASGRDTFLAHKFGSRTRNRKHDSSALFAHYRNAQRLPGRLEGNITIFWFAHGWFWLIPLADGSTSVGAVCWPSYLKTRGAKPLAAFFADTIALCPKLAARLQHANLIDGRVHATGNYAYGSHRCADERWLMVGDAYAFIDPVFSSGVYLAMQGAFDAAEVVQTCLDRPAQAAAARRRFESAMRKGPREFSWFIYRVTNPTMRELFMAPRNPLRMKEALLSLLAGDIHGATPIWGALGLLKAMYYLISVAHLKRSTRAWLQRRRHVRDSGPLAGETIVEAR